MKLYDTSQEDNARHDGDAKGMIDIIWDIIVIFWLCIAAFYSKFVLFAFWYLPLPLS